MGTIQRPIKVIHAPLNYAGQAHMLSEALRAEGIESTTYRLRGEGDGDSVADVFGYKDDRVVEYSVENRLGDLFRATQQIIAQKPDIVHLWNRSLIYGRHGGMFNGLDLPFIQLSGARVALRFTGYELRRKSLDMELNRYSPFHYGFASGFEEDDQKRFHDFIGPYIDTFVVQDPEMQTYCPQARIIPRVLDFTRFPLLERARNARPLVVHAPTQQHLKGTKFVLKAVEDLKDEGLDFDFELIEKLPNDAALERYRAADVIIDQLQVGWYGVLTMEAMALGKPVIAYIRGDLTGYFGDSMPLLNANPDTIKDVLRDAIKDGELREAVGRRARAFAEATHDGRVVARDVRKLYEEMLKAPTAPRMPDFSYQLAHGSSYYMFDYVDERLMTRVRMISSSSLDELERKLELLADAGSLADVERKLGVSSASEGHSAEAGNPPSPFEKAFLKLLRRLPPEVAQQLERNDKFLKLLLQIPAATPQELERKIISLIPRKYRAAAISLEKKRLREAIAHEAERFARLQDSYLVGLALRVPAANPQELEGKITSLIAESPRPRGYMADLVGSVRRVLFRSIGGSKQNAGALIADGATRPHDRG